MLWPFLRASIPLEGRHAVTSTSPCLVVLPLLSLRFCAAFFSNPLAETIYLLGLLVFRYYECKRQRAKVHATENPSFRSGTCLPGFLRVSETPFALGSDRVRGCGGTPKGALKSKSTYCTGTWTLKPGALGQTYKAHSQTPRKNLDIRLMDKILHYPQ